MSKLPYWERNKHRALDETHDKLLKTIFGLQPAQALPERVINEYWHIKEICDIIGQPMTNRELVYVAVLSGVDHKAPSRMGMTEMVDAGIVNKMNEIEVYMRGQWRKAKVLDSNHRDRTVRVLIDGDNVPRNVSEETCRLPDEAALAKAKA